MNSLKAVEPRLSRKATQCPPIGRNAHILRRNLRALIKIYARVTLIFVGPKSNFRSIANEIIGGRFMTALDARLHSTRPL
jgi:hypothetical protein